MGHGGWQVTASSWLWHHSAPDVRRRCVVWRVGEDRKGQSWAGYPDAWAAHGAVDAPDYPPPPSHKYYRLQLSPLHVLR